MLHLVHVELHEANQFVFNLHRHHDPVTGHRFSVGAANEGQLVGVAIVGRPVARKTNQHEIVEVLRLCTDGTKNACTFLYSACARVAQNLGYKSIQTFILETESGISLKASGWKIAGYCKGGDWSNKGTRERKTNQPQGPKVKWEKVLNVYELGRVLSNDGATNISEIRGQ